MRMLRFKLGRALIHAGLKAFPPGRARDELTSLLWEWGAKVRTAVAHQGR